MALKHIYWAHVGDEETGSQVTRFSGLTWSKPPREDSVPSGGGLARQRREQGVDFGGLVLRAHILERLRRFPPRQTRIRGVPQRPRRLTEFSQHFGLKKQVLNALCLQDPV